MNDQTDSQLLGAWAESRSEPAFAELVRRHVDLVYSATLRMVCDSHLAKDVTQSVFVALAKDAARITDRRVLSGWLHRTAHNIAAQSVRTDVRRRSREQEAVAMNQLLATETDAPWEHIAPHLDTALGELSEPGRDAVLLRYFENKSLREVGQALGMSDDAAQKRVSRAVERLREFFVKRGITVGASGLVAVITANAVQAAPVGLAVTISTAAALAGTTLAATATATAIKTIAMTTLQKTIVGTVLAAAIGTGIYEARQASRLRTGNQNLASQQQTLTDERDKALAAAKGQDSEFQRLQKDKNELLRLRGEVGLLRRQTNELARLREDNRQLQALLAKSNQAAQQAVADPEDAPERRAAYAKMSDAKLLVLGLLMHADDNQDRLPANLNQITNYLGKAEQALTGTNQFELVAQGSLKSFTNPAETIVVRGQDVWIWNGHRQKTYGFADGHSEIKREPPGGFDAWEQQHMIPPQTSP